MGLDPIPRQGSRTEQEQLRPYRRFVMITFAAAIAVTATLVIRGIIRHLDRIPSVDTLGAPEHVDARALRACREDLDRLEASTRIAFARSVSEIHPTGLPPMEWEHVASRLEAERITISARCRLNDPGTDAAARDLEKAAGQIESALRSYGLLYARFREDAFNHAAHARESLERAAEALRAR